MGNRLSAMGNQLFSYGKSSVPCAKNTQLWQIIYLFQKCTQTFYNKQAYVVKRDFDLRMYNIWTSYVDYADNKEACQLQFKIDGSKKRIEDNKSILITSLSFVSTRCFKSRDQSLWSNL